MIVDVEEFDIELHRFLEPATVLLSHEWEAAGEQRADDAFLLLQWETHDGRVLAIETMGPSLQRAAPFARFLFFLSFFPFASPVCFKLFLVFPPSCTVSSATSRFDI